MQSVQLQDLKTLGLRQKWCLAIEELANPILHVLPFLLGSPIRRLFLKLFAREVGREVFIANHVSIRHVYNLRMGNHIGINQDVIIHCRGGVTIGNDVLIGQRVIINTGGHIDPEAAHSLPACSDR
jgi:acetyltransferase-like isoleucine patch superfamily enzyme